MKLLLTVLALAAPAFSQTLSVKDALVKHWKVTGDFTMAVAKMMPADSWAFRPNPEEMTFGELMVHIAGANLNACANAANIQRPAIPEAIQKAVSAKQPADRDLALQFVTDSFKFCNDVVAGMTTEKLETVTGLTQRKMSGFEWLWSYFTHTAHHRGQAEVYLRVKGIKPPEYAF
jgi:uncharacterized damage-inducible protein DinB